MKRRIVVVDDEIALNHFLADLLEMEGYEVDTFTDPLQALDAIHATPQKFDLVITDQSMPHMSGMELSVAIRELNPDLPIILCTGYSATTNETLAKASGVNEYLTKPIKSRQLLNVMEQLLRERSVSV